MSICRVGFLLLPQFSMLSFTTALEPMRAANRLSARELYSWRLYAANAEPVSASNGLTLLADAALGTDQWADLVFVCGGLDVHRYCDDAVLRWLNRQAARGIPVGGIAAGPYVLAQAGLLRGYRCTIHWENLPGFAETFPGIETTENVFEIDRERYTCSGGTAALDMICYLISQEHGRELADAVSMQFIHDRIRTPGDQQRKVHELQLMRKSPKLASAIRVMASHVEHPLSASEIAARVGVSVRQLERLFRKHEQYTPQRYYLSLRLQHARRLLWQTGMPVMGVALATGFSSQSHFTKCYREQFSITPQRERLASLG
jgi:transcriptional regulator GlxA family with amidase domain